MDFTPEEHDSAYCLRTRAVRHKPDETQNNAQTKVPKQGGQTISEHGLREWAREKSKNPRICRPEQFGLMAQMRYLYGAKGKCCGRSTRFLRHTSVKRCYRPELAVGIESRHTLRVALLSCARELRSVRSAHVADHVRQLGSVFGVAARMHPFICVHVNGIESKAAVA